MKVSVIKIQSRIHSALFRLTGGLVGRRFVGNDVLLLTTIGSMSSRRHTVPLLYVRHGESLVVVASDGGRPRHPQWYRNLVQEEMVGVQIERSHREMVARTASPSERTVLWPRVVAAFSGYAAYQARVEREIPVVILDRVPAPPERGEDPMLEDDVDR